MRTLAILPLLPLALAGASDWPRTPPGDLPGACDAFVTPYAAYRTLTGDYGLTSDDVARVARGKVYSVTVPTQDAREIAGLGVIRVPTSPGLFTGFAGNVESLLDYEYLTEIGPFGPADSSTDSFEIPVRREDVRAVRTCVPGMCDMKLPTETITAITQLDREAHDFPDQVSGLVRDRLRRYLRDYMAAGNAGLPVYADKREPQSVRDGIGYLLRQARVLQERAPHLYQHLDRPSTATQGHVDVAYFWSIEEFGMRPLTTMSESAHYRPDRSESWATLKLLYASHYLVASLRIIRMIEGSPDDAAGCAFLIWDDRALFDERVGGIKRALLARHLRSSLSNRLKQLRDRLGEYDRLIAARTADRGA